ncbi:MAG: polysulfide reductase NrfD [Deltaproteobacteria bacterium]|nr:polysulfide reductase NrfD [Deltaproteobacteria bacterium]
MHEIYTMNTNPLTPAGAVMWGWEIPVYLFLGGLAAGLLIIAALLRSRVDEPRAIRLATLAAPIALSIGMGALWLDLAYKLHVYRFYGSFQLSSPMSWGAWLLVAFYPVSVLMYLSLHDSESFARLCGRFSLLSRLEGLQRFARARRVGVERAAILSGIGLGVYTGILLSALSARAAWNSAVLGPLFLVSGFSTAAAALMLLSRGAQIHGALRRLDVVAIAAELALIGLFLIGLLSGGATQQRAAALFLGGPLTATFWSLVVVTGLVVPLSLSLLERPLKLRPTAVIPVMVLIGGFALRWILVSAGQLS